MVSVWVSVVTGLASFAMSMIVVTFAVGRTYGEVKGDIKQIRQDLAKIEGMFVLRLRDDYTHKGD